MWWKNRPDGTFIENLPPLRLIMPFLMPGRNESVAYFDMEMDVTDTLNKLDEWNSANPERQIKPFHVMLWSMVQTLHERQGMHRFVVGKRLFQRKHYEISFAVKKQFEDKSPITTVKVRFDPGDSVLDVVDRLTRAVGTGRGKKETTSESEVRLLSYLPAWLLTLIFALQKWADGWNLLPAKMIETDPMYASIFVANLGSIGLDSVYHHLYEYGTIPLFIVIGRIKTELKLKLDGGIEQRQIVSLKFSHDERITDGFYCSRTLQKLKEFIETPDKWLPRE